MMVFDLDPGAPAGIVECCEVALVLRGLFEQLGLQSVAKTSGSKGMQVYVPLNTPIDYEQTKPFARRVAELLEQRLPELVVSRMTKRLRAGRVLVDWSQNDDHKTTVTVYSVRARERRDGLDAGHLGGGVGVPRGRRRRAADVRAPRRCSPATIDHGDLFAPLLSVKQRLPALG